MSTAKRTTARYALDTKGQKILLLATMAREAVSKKTGPETREEAYRATYESIRNAVESKGGEVWINIELPSSGFYAVFGRAVGYPKDTYQIGCHFFTLSMFNRILRAAGVKTTKTQTKKKFAAAAR